VFKVYASCSNTKSKTSKFLSKSQGCLIS